MRIMNYLLSVCTILTTIILGSSGSLSDIEPGLKIIEKVNRANTTWKAGPNYVTCLNEEKNNHLVGSTIDLSSVPQKHEVTTLGKKYLPKTFDARKKWKRCPSISAIKDQGFCGGCWAVSSASVMSDRICIDSKQKIKVNISSEELISCCTECGSCKNGYVDKAWMYFIREGVVTGGDYGSNEGCKPSSIVPSNYNCLGSKPTTPKCLRDQCTNSHYHHKFRKDLHFGSELYSISMNVNAIQSEIFNHGPVVAIFTVYSDFYYYKSGVYQHITGDAKGLHSVRVLGWGTDNGTDYWLVANSWGSHWGEKGLFRIIRGTNDCHFERTIISGTVLHK